MRPSSLIMVLLVAASCTVRTPPRVPVPVAISIKGRVHVPAQVHVHTQGQVHGQVQGQVQGDVQVQGQVHGQGTTQVEAPPPPPPVLVSVQSAPVVEFFGIPLEGAQDVVFVLDCSGSMSSYARGRLAEIAVAPPPAPETAPPEPAQQAAAGAPPDPTQLEPDATAPVEPDATAPVEQPASPPRPRKIDVARYELVDAVERLPLGTRLNVVFFNDALEAFAPRMVPLDDAGRTNLVSFVHDVQPDGRTALAPAMRAAFLMNASRIVLLSDGLGNVGGDDASLLRDAREAMRGGVRIDTIGVGSDQDVTLLRTLAAESGGLYQGL